MSAAYATLGREPALAPRPALPARPAHIGAPIVLLTGGKGGVGKTLLTANLGIELARRGRRVLLVDLDLGLANLDVVLRVRGKHHLEDALAGRARFEDCVVDGPGRTRVLPASSGSVAMGALDPVRRARLLRGLRELAAGHDLVLCDGAAGIGPDVLAFCAAADHVLLVTTSEPAAQTDAYGLIKALHAWSEATGREIPTPELVVNQVASLAEAEHVAAKLRNVCQRFLSRAPHAAGWLPAARAIARSAIDQLPFALGAGGTERAPERDGDLALTCLRSLATRLERLCAGSARLAAAQGIPGHDR